MVSVRHVQALIPTERRHRSIGEVPYLFRAPGAGLNVDGGAIALRGSGEAEAIV